jgi:hypothetical protein
VAPVAVAVRVQVRADRAKLFRCRLNQMTRALRPRHSFFERWIFNKAVSLDPNFDQAFASRGLAAGSYARAISLRPKDDAANSGVARVGGKAGQSYDTF